MKTITKKNKKTEVETLINVEEFLKLVDLTAMQPKKVLTSLIEGLLIENNDYFFFIEAVINSKNSQTLTLTDKIDSQLKHAQVNNDKFEKTVSEMGKLASFLITHQGADTSRIYYDKKRKGLLCIDSTGIEAANEGSEKFQLVAQFYY